VTEAQYLVIGTAATRVAGLISGELDFVIDPAGAGPSTGWRKAPNVKVEQGHEHRHASTLGFDYSRDSLLYSDVKGKNPLREPARAASLPARHRHRRAAIEDHAANQGEAARGDLHAARGRLRTMRFDAKACLRPPRVARALLKDAGLSGGLRHHASTAARSSRRNSILPGGRGDAGPRGRGACPYQPLPFNVVLPKLLAGDTSFYSIGWATRDLGRRRRAGAARAHAHRARHRRLQLRPLQ